ncbi:MAG: DoxX family protein, partial [Bacteroidales bacterium]|nr:DoxX family protein [Bacteroidales bacterium]
MNFITQLFRLIIGALFVFSGFVKMIDPLGSAYKFSEYFSADVLNLEFLIPYALPFSIFLIIAETLLGIMLLTGYKSKFTTWSLLIMMVVFLFLTFYSAYTNKVTDCGCFGDFLKLDTWPTFYKNLIFTPMILWLVAKAKDIRPFYSRKLSGAISTLFLLIFIGITYYVLNHLPIFDFRPYAIGKDIPSQMLYPEGAKADVFKDTWVYKVDGVEKTFTTEDKPWEIEGAEYVDRKTVLIEKGYEPPIH